MMLTKPSEDDLELIQVEPCTVGALRNHELLGGCYRTRF